MPRVLTDFRFPATFTHGGEKWQTIRTRVFSARELLSADLVVSNQWFRTALVAKAFGKKVVVVDLVLRPPTSELKRRMMKTVFGRIDFFIHYFRDTSGYDYFYGIGPERSGYVPFKANLHDRYQPRGGDGDYVLCLGRSMRDYPTFFAATIELNAAIPEPNRAWLAANNSILGPIPQHIRLLPDDGTRESQIRIIEGARVVALPVLPNNICASGIGTYLNAMWLGKACVLTADPGVSDVLTDQALIVPPGDSHALRKAIDAMLSDDERRRAIAERGRRYAESLGGVDELSVHVQNEAMRWWYSNRR